MTDQSVDASSPERPFRLPDYQVAFRDCADGETARRIAAEVNIVVVAMGRFLPLERLDGFTFADDYTAALSELDRGFEATGQLSATNEDFGAGVAMSPTVLRDGVIKTRVVLIGWLGHALIGQNHEDRAMAVNLIAHELSHVGCHLIMEESLPGVMLLPITDEYEGALYRHSNACWDEYFASHWSAALKPDQLGTLRETLVSALEQADARILAAKEIFWKDRVLERVVDDTLASISSMMKFSGYLLGHADGINADPYDEEGRLLAALREAGLRDWFDTLHERVRGLFARSGLWRDLDEFFVLNACVAEAADNYNIELCRSDEFPLWINIYDHRGRL